MGARHLGLIAGLCVGVGLAAPAWSQVKAGSETGLGLSGADVPQLLKDIKAEPYKAAALPVCDTIPAEIQQITDLVGPDLDTPPPEETAEARGASLASKGVNVARGLVPYRGLVRFATGANKKDQELRDAIIAGVARRAYLRGVLSLTKCQPDPAPEPQAAPEPKPRKRAKTAHAG